ncbi:hypothetical protein E2C01_070232 [Portunus trituberculatus]|uniref:Uncharacterized protein n=1 Tax=Portunus trituberculatus TaxID=210409 RepID=A0A5B7I120_PORTR|nr:hypothetical protein [Portunus trituberculatus]
MLIYEGWLSVPTKEYTERKFWCGLKFGGQRWCCHLLEESTFMENVVRSNIKFLPCFLPPPPLIFPCILSWLGTYKGNKT